MAQPEPHHTPEQYLALERAASTKSEYLGGRMFALAGASRRHNLITLNIGAELRTQLRRRKCEVYSSDMQVKIPATGFYTYPDVVAVCDEPVFEDSELDTLINPMLIVEVLSKSTADNDRGGKFEHYRSLPSLREVLFVDQHLVHIVQYQRQANDAWLLSETRDPDGRLVLPSIDAELEIPEVYAKVAFGRSSGPKLVPGAAPVPGTSV